VKALIFFPWVGVIKIITRNYLVGRGSGVVCPVIYGKGVAVNMKCLSEGGPDYSDALVPKLKIMNCLLNQVCDGN
jgi:hypothetical protein